MIGSSSTLLVKQHGYLSLRHLPPVADPGGANPAMAPPSKLAMEFGPPRGGKSNGSIGNLCKCKGFGPPRIDVGYGFAPPPTDNRAFKT